MIKSSLYDYNGVYIAGDNAAARQADERNKGVIFTNCAPFTNCKSETNNIEIDNAKDIDIVMQMYNLIEYSDNYSKHLDVCANITEISQMII